MGFSIQGDSLILWVLFYYRFLQSGQISRLTDRSSQVIRRRISRVLEREGYVVKLERSPGEEQAYALGRAGFEFIAFQQRCDVGQLPYSRRNARVKPHFWQHTVLVNNIRIDLELALQNHPELQLVRSIPEWEMANPKAKNNHEKFVLWERIELDGRNLTVRPDGAFIVQYPNGVNVVFFLEADRGTESVRRQIKAKIEAYNAYYNQQLYWHRFNTSRMCVLFVLESKTEKRIASIQKQLQQFAKDLDDPEGERNAEAVRFFRFCRSEDINPSTILEETIWSNWRNEEKRLYSKRRKEGAEQCLTENKDGRILEVVQTTR